MFTVIIALSVAGLIYFFLIERQVEARLRYEETQRFRALQTIARELQGRLQHIPSIVRAARPMLRAPRPSVPVPSAGQEFVTVGGPNPDVQLTDFVRRLGLEDEEERASFLNPPAQLRDPSAQVQIDLELLQKSMKLHQRNGGADATGLLQSALHYDSECNRCNDPAVLDQVREERGCGKLASALWYELMKELREKPRINFSSAVLSGSCTERQSRNSEEPPDACPNELDVRAQQLAECIGTALQSDSAPFELHHWESLWPKPQRPTRDDLGSSSEFWGHELRGVSSWARELRIQQLPDSLLEAEQAASECPTFVDFHARHEFYPSPDGTHLSVRYRLCDPVSDRQPGTHLQAQQGWSVPEFASRISLATLFSNIPVSSDFQSVLLLDGLGRVRYRSGQSIGILAIAEIDHASEEASYTLEEMQSRALAGDLTHEGGQHRVYSQPVDVSYLGRLEGQGVGRAPTVGRNGDQTSEHSRAAEAKEPTPILHWEADPARWVLVGVSPGARPRVLGASLHLPASNGLGVGVLALIVLAPFIRLLMRPVRGSLSLNGLLLLGVSLALLAGLTTATVLYLASERDRVVEVKRHLASVGHGVVATLNAELNRAAADFGAWEAFLPRIEKTEARNGKARWGPEPPPRLRSAEELFVVDDQGNEIAMSVDWRQSREENEIGPRGLTGWKGKFPNVAFREYFRLAVESRGWRLKAARDGNGGRTGEPYAVERIESIGTGVRSTAFARSVDCPSSPTRDDGTLEACVAVLIKRLEPMSFPVLWDPVGYAVVTRSGRVLFHSEDWRSLKENLIDDADGDPHLAHLVAQGQPGYVEGTYRGRPHTFRVLPASTSAGVPWVVVTFVDNSLLQAFNSEVLWITIAAFVVYCSYLALVALALALASRDLRRPWLWPRGADSARAVGALALLGFVTMIDLSVHHSPAALVTLLVLPFLTLAVLYRFLDHGIENRRLDVAVRYGALLWGLMAGLAHTARMVSVYPGDGVWVLAERWVWEAGLAILSPLLGAWIWQPEGMGESGAETRVPRRFEAWAPHHERASFTAVVLAMMFTVCVTPTLSIYSDVLDFYTQAITRHGQQAIAQQWVRAWAAEVENDSRRDEPPRYSSPLEMMRGRGCEGWHGGKFFKVVDSQDAQGSKQSCFASFDAKKLEGISTESDWYASEEDVSPVIWFRPQLASWITRALPVYSVSSAKIRMADAFAIGEEKPRSVNWHWYRKPPPRYATNGAPPRRPLHEPTGVVGEVRHAVLPDSIYVDSPIEVGVVNLLSRRWKLVVIATLVAGVFLSWLIRSLGLRVFLVGVRLPRLGSATAERQPLAKRIVRSHTGSCREVERDFQEATDGGRESCAAVPPAALDRPRRWLAEEWRERREYALRVDETRLSDPGYRVRLLKLIEGLVVKRPGRLALYATVDLEFWVAAHLDPENGTARDGEIAASDPELVRWRGLGSCMQKIDLGSSSRGSLQREVEGDPELEEAIGHGLLPGRFETLLEMVRESGRTGRPPDGEGPTHDAARRVVAVAKSRWAGCGAPERVLLKQVVRRNSPGVEHLAGLAALFEKRFVVVGDRLEIKSSAIQAYLEGKLCTTQVPTTSFLRALRKCDWNEIRSALLPAADVQAWTKPSIGRLERGRCNLVRELLWFWNQGLSLDVWTVARLRALSERDASLAIRELRALGQALLRQRWVLSTPGERLVLYQLARRRLVDHRNRAVIASLTSRGLVRENPFLHVASEALRHFVLDHARGAGLDQMERAVGNGGWDVARAVLAVVAGFALLYMAGLQPETIQRGMLVIASLAGFSQMAGVSQLASLTGGRGTKSA